MFGTNYATTNVLNKSISDTTYLINNVDILLLAELKLAELLTDNLPDKLGTVYFTNSGTEAIEGAMKLAKRSTGRSEIISCKNSYHGSTQGALSIMGNEIQKTNFRPLLPEELALGFGRFLSFFSHSK